MQRSAHREFAVRDDLSHGGIAGERQSRAQRLQIERLADVDLERVGLDVAAGRKRCSSVSMATTQTPRRARGSSASAASRAEVMSG